jgi:hypothetical protein
MPLSTLLVIIAIAIIVLILILFPEARSLLTGFTRLFIKDMATTPEGAEAIYGEKIEQAQEAYNRADDSYRKASGKLEMSKRDLKNLKERLSKVESECEALVKAGKLDHAQIKVDEREDILSDIQRCESMVKAYTEASTSAKEAYEACERNLRKLKRESKEVVENMKVKQQLKEVYDDMDELKATTGTDKLVESIREKNKDLDSIVEGSKVVHENRATTKAAKAEAEAKKLQSNDYLESLKKKYNK